MNRENLSTKSHRVSETIKAQNQIIVDWMNTRDVEIVNKLSINEQSKIFIDKIGSKYHFTLAHANLKCFPTSWTLFTSFHHPTSRSLRLSHRTETL